MSNPVQRNQSSKKRAHRRRDPERRRGERKWNDPAVRREKHGFRPGESPAHGWSLAAAKMDRACRGERQER